MSIRAAQVAAVLVVTVLAIAGVAKLVDLGSFVESIGTWTLIPPLLRPIIAVLAPVSELLLGLLLIARVPLRLVSFIATGLLSVYSAAYGAHVAFAEPPDCACFGKLTSLVK